MTTYMTRFVIIYAINDYIVPWDLSNFPLVSFFSIVIYAIYNILHDYNYIQ